ncbi:MAG: tRNA (adenosine(37)-N6)-dimethylallyltransferase MiaA [Patescibacteria group bacterium]|nr:tRNA (adenosine(37)-N6)-dimethylallyltransferase MiaA [Patescibacteria group bacterium]
MWKAIFITGPTSSGKSDFAIYLAKKINGEIISADSRQVYKYLDAGSGKIETVEKEKLILSKNGLIPHYLLSIASPRRNYSLFQWLKKARKHTLEILKRNRVPIFCGGTILYLRALKEGWQLPEAKPNYYLRKKLEKLPSPLVYKKLLEIDQRRAKEIGLQNKRRLIRALEICYSLGKVPKLIKKPDFEFLILSPHIDKEKLFKKIEKRLKMRVPKIISEIKELTRRKIINIDRIISFGLEYEWFGRYVKGEISKKQAIDNCYHDILNFAKRQIRELRKMPDIIYFENKIDLLKIVLNFKSFLI